MPCQICHPPDTTATKRTTISKMLVNVSWYQATVSVSVPVYISCNISEQKCRSKSKFFPNSRFLAPPSDVSECFCLSCFDRSIDTHPIPKISYGDINWMSAPSRGNCLLMSPVGDSSQRLVQFANVSCRWHGRQMMSNDKISDNGRMYFNTMCSSHLKIM